MATKKSSASRYSPGASAQVATELHEMKAGRLKSGTSGKKVTNPKQAIAIGLSEARRAGKKVPAPPSKTATTKSAAASKPAAKKPAKKKAAKKKAAKKSSSKK